MTTESRQYANKLDDGISLKQFLLKLAEWYRFLYSKGLIILFFGLLGALMGFAYSYFNKPIYTATTTFVLEDEKGGMGLGNLAGLASIAGVDLGSGGGIFQGDNILQLYKSRTMLEKTLFTSVTFGTKKQLLIERYIEFKNLKEEWKNRPSLSNLYFTETAKQDIQDHKPNRLRDSITLSIIKDINKNLLTVVKPDKKLSAIQVDVRSEDELFSQALNNELVRNVNKFYIDTKTKKTLQNVKILQHKTDSVRNVMNGAIYSSVAVSDATPNLNPTRQVQRIYPSQKAQFSAETNRAILAEMVKNLEMSKLALLKETPLIQVVDEPILPLTKQKFGKAKGIVLGGLFAVLFSAAFLLTKRDLKLILSQD